LVYLAMAYTDYRGWYSHYDTTPFANQRKRELADFFQTGALPPDCHGRTFLLIVPKNDLHEYGGVLASPVLYENEGYRVQTVMAP
jgi:hypothetical protein